MNKGDLVRLSAERSSQTQKATEEILTAAIALIQEAVASGTKVTLAGFGTFERVGRKARAGRNPSTGEVIAIPARSLPKFSPGKNFKELVQAE